MLFPGPHVGWPNTSNIVCVSDGVYPPHPLQIGTQKPLEIGSIYPIGGSIYPIDGGYITVGFPRPLCLPLNTC